MIKFNFAILFLIFFCGCTEDSFISRIEQKSKLIFEIQKDAQKISFIFEDLPPFVIYERGFLYLFEPDNSSYKFIKKVKAKRKYFSNIRAAMPIEELDFKMLPLVSDDIFKSREELILLFHEFVHVYQFKNGELELKNKLQIYKNAIANKDYMWEINYDFPYNNEDFIMIFGEYLNLLKNSNLKKAVQKRRELKTILSIEEVEYLNWQEFKEGYARFIENNIKNKYNLKENHYGEKKPFSRIAFYESGSLLIHLLLEENPELKNDFTALYEKISN